MCYYCKRKNKVGIVNNADSYDNIYIYSFVYYHKSAKRVFLVSTTLYVFNFTFHFFAVPILYLLSYLFSYISPTVFPPRNISCT